ncbi:MAG TPA: hypothetical protein VFG35_13110 [Actinoplanes sp.]|nr:hypothetical protein [Actinoplanes sp.]
MRIFGAGLAPRPSTELKSAMRAATRAVRTRVALTASLGGFESAPVRLVEQNSAAATGQIRTSRA